MKKLICFITLLISQAAAASAITVENCGKPLTFEHPPKTLVTHDINMTQMAFALGLQKQMIGITGVTGYYKTTPEFQKQQGDIPELAPKYASLEQLVKASPDVYFAGWNYGMRIGGEVTPDSLKPFRIHTLVLNESCSHVMKHKQPATMAQMFNDVSRLATLFGKQAKAKQLIQKWQKELDAIKAKTKGHHPLKVFLYDSGEEKPFTAGKYAIVNAMIKAAGGKNVMNNLEISWGTTSWENVALQNPDLIILLDYQNSTGAKGLQHFLEHHPVMKLTTAVEKQQYIPLRYEEITPGPANIDAIEKIAQRIAQINAKTK